ncbi:MAG: hypothetical protein ACC645_18210, partial [Pirellulales bacterium]
RGRRRWGARATGKYHTCQAGDIVPRETYNGDKPPEDAILANGVELNRFAVGGSRRLLGSF